MTVAFEALIDSFMNERIGITQDFIPALLAQQLQDQLLDLYKQNSLQQAQIGNLSQAKEIKEIRGDQIYWLDRSHQNAFEVREHTILFDTIRPHPFPNGWRTESIRHLLIPDRTHNLLRIALCRARWIHVWNDTRSPHCRGK